MSTHEVAAARQQAGRIVLGQIGVTALLAVICSGFWGVRTAAAVLVGGGIGLLATGYLLIAMIRGSAHVSGSPNVGALLLTWLVKTALTVSLLLIALRSKKLPPLGLLTGFVATLVGYWLSLILVRVKHADSDDGE